MNERLDQTMSALSHPIRRAILDRLMQGEARVTELASPFEMSLNAVSRHIRVLERAGLVRRQRVWREHRLSFDAGPLDEASAWIEKRRVFWTRQLEALDAMLSSEDAQTAIRGRPAKRSGSRKGT